MVFETLSMSFAMGWEILWALILGFLLSASIQAVVSKKQMAKLLPDSKPRSLTKATLLGAASSSCSYAAVAIARSIFTKGANFVSAIAFEIASTNLVIELGIIMAILLGWQFTLAELIGGPIMIIIFALLARWFIKPTVVAAARKVAEQRVQGKMEGHAHHDIAVSESGSIIHRIKSNQGKVAISHYFVMDWQMVWKDIVIGLLIAGAAATIIPASFWERFFFTSHPMVSAIWGPIIGPIVAILSFVCSIGNVPLAAVLWNGGISFGGVISFIFADLIVIPIINIYRKYYGWKMAIRLSALLYVAMVFAGYAIELIFGALHLIPQERIAEVIDASVTWNYTSILNIAFLAIALVVLVTYFRSKRNNTHNHDHMNMAMH